VQYRGGGDKVSQAVSVCSLLLLLLLFSLSSSNLAEISEQRELGANEILTAT
jgi:hypothetical protein